MKTTTVSLKPYYNRVFYGNRIFARPETSNPFFDAQKFYRDHGIDLRTIDLVAQNESDIIVCCDVPYPWELSLWCRVMRAKFRILLNFESPIINPFSQMPWIRKIFHQTLTWESGIQQEGVSHFNIPHPLKSTFNKVNKGKKRLLVAVVSQKRPVQIFTLLSKYKVSYYELRNDLIFRLANHYQDYFDLYGRNWQGANIRKSYKGSTDDKLKTLSQYKFGLAIENVSAPGYITEKIFDCFAAGCVPIYLGAPDIEKHIPKSCFIDLRSFTDDKKLMRHLLAVDSKTYQAMLAAGKSFFTSEATKDAWSRNIFHKRIITTIQNLSQ